MKNKIQFYIGLIASGFLASSALAQFSLTNGGTNNISNGTPEVAPAIYVVGGFHLNKKCLFIRGLRKSATNQLNKQSGEQNVLRFHGGVF